jgi:hypothetical protein
MKKDFKTLINESTDAKVLFTWGRFNPPTSGHEKLIKKLSSEAAARGADFKVFPTKSEDPKKNPLAFKSKVKFMKKAFPSFKKNISSDVGVRTIIDALKKLYKDGYKEATVVVGSDRVKEFKRLVNKYNGGRDFKFDKVDVISAGKRNPDAEDTSGMSASKLRSLALDDKKKDFMSGLPSKMSKKDGSDMFAAVRKGMQLEQIHSILDQRDIEYLEEGILTKALGAVAAWKGVKKFRNRKQSKLGLDLDKELEKSRKDDPSEKYRTYRIAGSKFNRLLRIGLVQTREISPTQQAFLHMKRSGSNPTYRDLIFKVTQNALEEILSDSILYNRFIVLLQRKSMFGESHFDGLVKKSDQNDVGLDLILEVYFRGLMDWDESQKRDPNQYAFDRVNSFLSGGHAQQLDSDLLEDRVPPPKSVKSKVKFKEPKDRAGDWGTEKPANKYLKTTPGQPNKKRDIKDMEYGKRINIDDEFSNFVTKEH